MSPDLRFLRSPFLEYWCWSSSCSTRARVAGATSGRPFTTFETVGSETPASAAITASVVFRSSSRALSRLGTAPTCCCRAVLSS